MSWAYGGAVTRYLAVVAALAVATTASACGDSDEHGRLRGLRLTTADVQKAFKDEGLTLTVDKDKAPWIHFLWYETDDTHRGEHIAVFVFDEQAGAADARVYKQEAAGASNIDKVLVAKNVVVALLPYATADERERARAAVSVLKMTP
jgi:hypothetical protein